MTERKTNTRTPAHKDTDRNFSTLQPGRSQLPPAFAVTAKTGKPKPGNVLRHAIGRGGKNLPEDLIAFGESLAQAGVPSFLVGKLMDIKQNGNLIARYQKEVLGFRNPDGRVDPGGKTIKAMLALKGREIVAQWFKPKPASKTPFAPSNKNDTTLAKEIPPVLSEAQYFSQYNQGAPCVPLSLLKQNLSPKSSERKYRNVGCYQTCRYMLMQEGFAPGTRTDAEYLLNMKTTGSSKAGNFEKTIGGLTGNFASSLSELDKSLMKGVPVIVGVNKNTKSHTWTNTKPDGKVSPTDHFVVIVGKSISDDGRVAYRFFDPGRYSVANGASPNNLIFQNDSGQIAGTAYKNHIYSLSEIRVAK